MPAHRKKEGRPSASCPRVRRTPHRPPPPSNTPRFRPDGRARLARARSMTDEQPPTGDRGLGILRPNRARDQQKWHRCEPIARKVIAHDLIANGIHSPISAPLEQRSQLDGVAGRNDSSAIQRFSAPTTCRLISIGAGSERGIAAGDGTASHRHVASRDTAGQGDLTRMRTGGKSRPRLRHAARA